MGYPPLRDTFRCVTHPFATRHQGCPRAAVRLACVKHAASVQSEPGSNSSVQSLPHRIDFASLAVPQNHQSLDSPSSPQDSRLLLLCRYFFSLICLALHARLNYPSCSLKPNQSLGLTLAQASPEVPTPIGCPIVKVHATHTTSPITRASCCQQQRPRLYHAERLRQHPE